MKYTLHHSVLLSSSDEENAGVVSACKWLQVLVKFLRSLADGADPLCSLKKINILKYLNIRMRNAPSAEHKCIFKSKAEGVDSAVVLFPGQILVFRTCSPGNVREMGIDVVVLTRTYSSSGR